MFNHALLFLSQTDTTANGMGGKVAAKVEQTANHISDQPAYQRASEQFANGTADSLVSTEWIMVAGGVVLFAFGLIGFLQWWKARHERSQPMTVFYRAGKQVGLRKRDMWLLRKIAKYTGLPTPLALMMSSSTLLVHASVYVEARSIKNPKLLMDDVERIAIKLFTGYQKGDYQNDVDGDDTHNFTNELEANEALSEALKMVG